MDRASAGIVSSRQGRGGTSLLEVMVGFALLSACLLLLLGLVPALKASNQRAEAELRAGQRAQSLLEECRSRSYDAVQSHVLPLEQEGRLKMFPRLTVSPGQTASSKTVTATVVWNVGREEHTTIRETVLTRIPRP